MLRKYKTAILIGAVFLPVAKPLTTIAQVATGGPYTLDQSVIANGGGTSSGPNYSVEGTIAQHTAGITSSSGPFEHSSGFWQVFLAPTAAHVSVSGIVTSAAGEPLANIHVLISDPSGTIAVARTNNFGRFQINGLGVGETYVLSATGKGYNFIPRVITVQDEMAGVNIRALP